MKIVLVGKKTIGDDVDFSMFNTLGEFTAYDFADDTELPGLINDADVIIVNKNKINEKTIADAKKLKLVCVTATGTNNLDKDYLEERGIAWRNVAGYSTESVTQLTFALLFYLWNHMAYYDKYVKEEKYVNDVSFTHFAKTFAELNGKTWGIIGLGDIGRRVAEIASAFGAKVIYYSTSGVDRKENYPKVGFDELLGSSDIISIHCPLTEKTEHLIDKDALMKMKKSAVLLNLARGPIIDEAALAGALENGIIAQAGLDVLDKEPMSEDNPLRRIKDSDKLIITPHIAWAARETRQRLMQKVYENICQFSSSNPES